MRAALHNLLSYAVIQRHIIVPNEYAVRSQHPLVYRPSEFRRSYYEDVREVGDIDWTGVFAHYSYVWSCNVPETLNSYLLEVFRIPARSQTASHVP